MAKNKRPSKREVEWAEAKRLCRLSAEDVRKAKERLGWQPVTSLEQGLSETVAWYRRHWERL